MLCRITNDQPGPRVFFDTKLRPVLIHPGNSAELDLEPSTFEDVRACALVKLGPQIEALEEEEQPERAPPPPPVPLRPRPRGRRRVVAD